MGIIHRRGSFWNDFRQLPPTPYIPGNTGLTGATIEVGQEPGVGSAPDGMVIPSRWERTM